MVPAPAVEAPFSSFAAVQANQTVVLSANTMVANVSGTVDNAGNAIVGPTDFTAETAGTVKLSYDGNRQLSGISISAPLPNVSTSFSRGAGHSINCASGTCLAESPTASAAIIDPFQLGWNYQSFGVWAIDTGPTSAVFGVASAGNPTPGNAVPLSGNATFLGLTAGFYVSPVGTPFATASTLTANVDFGARSVGFATSDMTLVNVNTGAPSTRADLRINGNLSYGQGASAFSGPVTTQSGLIGSASGRFYGPAAEEMGGVYQLGGGSGVERMIGGFGARRTP